MFEYIHWAGFCSLVSHINALQSDDVDTNSELLPGLTSTQVTVSVWAKPNEYVAINSDMFHTFILWNSYNSLLNILNIFQNI